MGEERLPRQARGLLRHFGLRAKKSLGQHFLIDRRVLHRIVSAAELTPEDIVIEVGSGLGILTKELARQARWVIAIEADAKLASALTEIMAPLPNVSIINSDILQTDPIELLNSSGIENVTLPRYKVVANIPYYITSAVLRHFLEAAHKPHSMVVMVQKEVGEAIVAQPGEMSLLAVSVQFYGKPVIIARVPSRSFYPPPKVDSIILRIKLYERPPVEVPETKFFAVVRAGFSAPRKQLHNALAQGLGISPLEAAHLLERAMINPQRRAETLNLQEWARTCEIVVSHGIKV